MNRNMRLPSRTAPSLDEVRNNKNPNQRYNSQQVKKKPPPRPPPPNFNKIKSQSAWNLNNQFDNLTLIDLSPPESPKPFLTSRTHGYGGSGSSSFSSSTSSLASSKRSFEYESVNFENWALNARNASNAATKPIFYVNNGQVNVPAPTIIRPQMTKQNQVMKTADECLHRDNSPPMPTVPPPSPPKQFEEVTTPYGIALYDYRATQKDDLSFKTNEVIFLIHRINSEWLYGRIEDREGMFPNNYISIQVPLPDDDRLASALYEFSPQATGDLALKPGQSVLVTGRVSAHWLIGESNGCSGQFPANFIDRVPSNI